MRFEAKMPTWPLAWYRYGLRLMTSPPFSVITYWLKSPIRIDLTPVAMAATCEVC